MDIGILPHDYLPQLRYSAVFFSAYKRIRQLKIQLCHMGVHWGSLYLRVGRAETPDLNLRRISLI